MFFKKIISYFYAGLLLMVLFPGLASAVVLPGLVDRAGNSVHSADEFNLSITTTVTSDPYGYRYSYDLYSDVTSVQAVWHFMILSPDVVSVVSGSSTSPWGLGSEPIVGNSIESLSVSWTVLPEPNNPPLLTPGALLAGFSFVSPYPPGVVQAYAEGNTTGPYFDDVPPDPPAEFSNRTPYGPGKIIPVIGPIKPAVTGGSNYTVLSCAGLLCSVQISVLGPQDPNGTTYTYAWTGAFGTAVGVNPIVSLLAGTYPVQLSISDATGVLVTMTQSIVVPSPAIATITPAQLAALTPAQLAVFIAALTPAQAAALAPVQLVALTPAQVTAVIVSLTPAQIASLTPAQLVALTPAQVTLVSALLTPAQLAGTAAKHDDDDEEDKDKGDESEKDKEHND